jgi:glucose-6-phosphate isomerase
MVEAIASLIESRAWKALEVHAAVNRNLHLRDIFAQDPKRGVRLKVEAVGIYLDYSKKPNHRRDRRTAVATCR